MVNIEKHLIEVEACRKDHINRDNTFTVAVLEQAYEVAKELQKYRDAEEQGLLLRLEYPNGWIPVDEGLPPCSDDLLLIQCSGKPRANIALINALCLASYTEEGWILELYPDWDGAEVEVWQYLPEPYKS